MKPPAFHRGYFVAWRTDDFLELLRAKPNAFRLLTLIAYRARYRDGYSADGLGIGEAHLGRFDVQRELGLTPKEYRLACDTLEQGKFVALQRTHHGTVARIVDSRIFSPTAPDEGTPEGTEKDTPRAHEGHTEGHKEECKKGRIDKAPVIFAIPLELQGPEFHAAWTLWQQHRGEKRQKLTASSAKLQLDQLAEWGTARAVAAIRHSVAKGWLSIHEASGQSRAATGQGTAEIEARIKELSHEIPMRAGTPEASAMIKERDLLKAKLAAIKGGSRE